MSIYVLVHGAWHSGACWDRTVLRLESAGHQVYAPSLTGHGDRAHRLGPDVGLDTHVEDVVSLILAEDLTEVILVGHSYAGMLVSAVIDLVPERISHAVYVEALVPADGESAADVLPAHQVEFMIQLAEGAGDGWRIPPLPELPYPAGLFGVTDPDDVAWLRGTLSDQSLRTLQQPVRLVNPAADSVPRTHIHCVGGERRAVPPLQPNGEPAVVWELDTGHDCMITAPDGLTALLLKIP
ncbi:alpha/beta hydrolase [Streptomyces diacarni]|uniref:Alpha/beta hydrolase n=1 Tax=Streptomyces diacarni TaxID=2800381 RepID=A0A367FEZ5_9ACTN|nr:alpha/beta hydrolase [Streptomyces diacarni]RCG28489.1 alpha/beta hydrolase [Streptomyces diacarni]